MNANHVIVVDEHRHLDELPLVVALGEFGPGLVADAAGLVHLVGARISVASERSSIPSAPFFSAGHLVVGDTRRPARSRRAGPTRTAPGTATPPGGSPAPSRPGQRAGQHVVSERNPPPEQTGMTDERGEDVDRPAVRCRDRLDQLALFFGDVVRRERGRPLSSGALAIP